MEFFEGPVFYASAAILVVLALSLAFVGMRSEKFPGDGPLGGILIGLTAVMVLITGIGAVAEARHEQENRRAGIAEMPATEGNEEAEAPEGEGEIGGPGATASVEGLKVFDSEGCGSCHALQAADSAGQIGPSLDESLEDKDASFITTAILDPDSVVAPGFGPGIMPSDYAEELTPAELDALVGFLDQSTGN